MKASKQEIDAPKLVINYNSLNKIFKWIIYLLLNKLDLIKRLYNTNIFLKFDMRSGYYQISV